MTKQELINKLKGIDPNAPTSSYLLINTPYSAIPSTIYPSGITQSNTLVLHNIPIEDYIKLTTFQAQFEMNFNELSKLIEKYPNYPGLAKWDISKYTELFSIFMGQIGNLTLDDFKFMAHLPLNIIEIFIQRDKDNIKNINLSHLELEDLEYLHLKYFT